MLTPHELIKNYTDITIKSNKLDLFVLKGAEGLGKTYQVLKTLEGHGLKENLNYVYISGYITPLELFTTLAKCQTLESPKLFVLDDLNGILNNKTCVALLKSALWGKKVVSYQSSTSKLNEENTSISFTGKVIMIINSIKEAKSLSDPLLDRGIYFNFKLSPKEKIEYIESVLPVIGDDITEVDKLEVWRNIKRFSGNQRFSLRTLIRAFQYYSYSKENWFNLFLNTLELTPDQLTFYKVIDNSGADQLEAVQKETGKSRKTFFRYKKELIPKDNTERAGHVYLVKSGSYYKIGRTGDIETRLTNIKVGNPQAELLFNGWVRDCFQCEERLLKKFQDKKHIGEWFSLDGRDVEYVKKFIRRKIKEFNGADIIPQKVV